MSDVRKEAEEFIERGSWLETFNAARIKFPDSVIIDCVEIDPRLKPKQKRVWVYFFSQLRPTHEEESIADWRLRSAHG